MARPALYLAHQGFFDLTFVRASAPELSAADDDSLIRLLLDPDTACPPAPNCLFDSQHYSLLRARYGDGAPSNPILHYLCEGAEGDLSINPLFDEVFYQRNAGLDGLSAVAVVEHALSHLGPEIAPFSPFVDLDFICAQIGRTKGAELLADLFSGALQMDRPHPLFDLSHFRSQTLQRIETVQEALYHYWTCGEDLSTHPLIDVAHYKAQAEVPTDIVHSAYHYLISPNPASPHPLFDPAFYRDQAMAAFGRRPDRPLEHFISTGQAQGLSPSPFFDVDFYRRQSDCGPDALQHYLRAGHLRYAPHPLTHPAEMQLAARAQGTTPPVLLSQIATGAVDTGLSLLPEVDPDHLRQGPEDAELTTAAILQRYFRAGYPSGELPNPLLSRPYIEAQQRRLSGQGNTAIGYYFQQGWNRRQRILIALSTLEDNAANRAWHAMCKSQLGTPGVECLVLAARTGPMETAFREVAHLWQLNPQPPQRSDPEGMVGSVRKLAERLAANPPKLAFVDCAHGTDLLEAMTQLSVPLAAFGDAGLRRLSTGDPDQLAPAAELLCTSPALQAELQDAVPDKAQDIHSGFRPHITPPRPSPKHRATARAALGLTAEDIVVLSSGGPELEHGSDLFGAFVAQCCEDAKIPRQVKFVWHGPGKLFGHLPKFYAQHFVQTVGARDRFQMVEQMEPAAAMAAADVYVKLGRDGCPMDEVLHAQALGLPVLATQDGALESDGSLTVVPPFDLTTARHALRNLLENLPARAKTRAAGTESGALVDFIGGLNTVAQRLAPTMALSLPCDHSAGRMLVILPDETLFDRLAVLAGMEPPVDEILSVRLDHGHSAWEELPPPFAALATRRAYAEITVMRSVAGLSADDILRFDHAVWCAEGTAAELNELYLTGLAFDEIHTLAPEQIDEMRQQNPRIAEIMTATDWKGQ